jgi:hypothetical protein
MRLLILATFLAVVVPVGSAGDMPATKVPSPALRRLVGTWRLVSAEDIAPDGSVTCPFGRGASGVLTYDAAGTMTAQVMRKERAKWGAFEDANPEPLLSYVAYFGTFEVNERTHTITHHIRGHLDPARIGKDNVRRYELGGDKLTLIELERPVRHVTWERTR